MDRTILPLSAAKPLFLAPMARPGDNHLGYVTRPELAMRDEPECVGPAIVNGYAEAAEFHRTLQHQRAVEEARGRRPAISPEARVRDLHRRAKAGHVDISHELHLLCRDLTQARLTGREVPARTLARLERLEALLDGVELAA